MSNEFDTLIDAATRSRSNAYAPYSAFRVAAAVLTKSGRVFTGVNIENVSLGLTMCAERVCIGAAVAAGEREFEHLAIVTDAAEPSTPCGACRQVISEFAPDLDVTCATIAGARRTFRMHELLPHANQGIDVPRRT